MQTLAVDPEATDRPAVPRWTVFVLWFEGTLIAGGLWLTWLDASGLS